LLLYVLFNFGLILDVEESVVARVLSALTSLCELGLFQKMRIWELMSATLGFLYHPNIWIRQGGLCLSDTGLLTIGYYLGAAAFITAAGQHLPPSDIWCILYPSLRHFMKSDILIIDESGLLTALKPPVSISPLFRLFSHFRFFYLIAP